MFWLRPPGTYKQCRLFERIIFIGWNGMWEMRRKQPGSDVVKESHVGPN